MVEKLSSFFTQKGYMKVHVQENEVRVVFKLLQGKICYLCLIDDTAEWITDDRVSRILHTVGRLLLENEKLAKYAGSSEGLAVIVTNDPARTRQHLSDADNYWLIHEPTRRLMIYDNQPGDFYDVRPCLEEFLKQNTFSILFGQLKQLFSPVNTVLILANILIFIIMELAGSTEDVYFMHKWGAMSVYDILYAKEYFRLLTCAFLHFGTAHLVYNMIALLYLGKPLETVLGRWKYLVFYLLCALGSSLVSVGWYSWNDEIFSVSAGASGAICGVAGGVAYVLLRNRKDNPNFTFLRWAIFVALLMGQGWGDASINTSAHIGGMVTGFLLAVLIYHKKRKPAAPAEAQDGTEHGSETPGFGE